MGELIPSTPFTENSHKYALLCAFSEKNLFTSSFENNSRDFNVSEIPNVFQ